MNTMASLSNSKLSFQYHFYFKQSGKCFKQSPRRDLQVRASSSSAAPDVDLKTLESAISEKDSDAVKEALDQLSEVGWAKKWCSQPYVSRRTTSLRELTSLGIKNAETLAIPSVRNDAAFLFTVVGTTGFLGLLAGQLPGGRECTACPLFALPASSMSYKENPSRCSCHLNYNEFLRIISTADSFCTDKLLLYSVLVNSGLGLLCTIFDWEHFFNSFGCGEHFTRVSHNAAEIHNSHVAYLLGLPILGYSLDIGKEHVNLIDEKLEKLIYSGQLDAELLDRLAAVAMAGLAAEGLKYDKVIGQSADLFTLQRFINRSNPKLSNDQQQNLTRWAVLFAGSLLKNNKVIYEALMSAMSKKSTVLECIEAIEKAA
ncbi:hypothetical protein SCA6_013446 [Theobroma cacao]